MVFELVLCVTVNAPSRGPTDGALDQTVFPLISIPGSLGALECFAIDMLEIVGVSAPLEGAVSSTRKHKMFPVPVMVLVWFACVN